MQGNSFHIFVFFFANEKWFHHLSLAHCRWHSWWCKHNGRPRQCYIFSWDKTSPELAVSAQKLFFPSLSWLEDFLNIVTLALGNRTLKCGNKSLFQHFCTRRLEGKLFCVLIWQRSASDEFLVSPTLPVSDVNQSEAPFMFLIALIRGAALWSPAKMCWTPRVASVPSAPLDSVSFTPHLNAPHETR